MAAITNIAEVKTWLGTLTPGGSTDVSESLFNASMVTDVFKLLATESIDLTKIKVDIDNATLSGIGTILEQSNTNITLAFTQPDSTLYLDLNLQFTDLEWTLIDNFDLEFEIDEGEITPNTDVGTIGLFLTAQILAKDNVKLPIKLTVPSFEGDWVLTGSFDNIGDLTMDAISSLSGNNPITEILSSELIDIKYFSLSSYSITFNPIKKTVSLVDFDIDYAKPGGWSFFSDKFVVEDINLNFEVINPYNPPTKKTFQAKLDAKMKIAGVEVEVGGQFPDKIVYAKLINQSEINLTALFEYLQIKLPTGFPDIEITALSIIFFTADEGFEFDLEIGKPVPIAGKLELDDLLFTLSVNHSSGSFEGSGSVHTTFSIGKTKVLLSADYSSGDGITMEGKVNNLPIEDFVSALEHQFNISDIPDFIKNITIVSASITYNTKSKNFTFDLDATTELANQDQIEMKLTVGAIHNNDTYKKSIVGTLQIDKQIFQIDAEKSESESSLAATWVDKGTPLTIETIAQGLKIDMPQIPEGLDLGIENAGFAYKLSY